MTEEQLQPYQCKGCGKNAGLRDSDSGQPREILRLCHTCHKARISLYNSIIDYISSDSRFKKSKAVGAWFCTNKPIDLTKLIFGKGYGNINIVVFDEEEGEIEVRIKMKVDGYNLDFETIFEGFVESMDDFKVILRCLGIQLTNL